MRRWTHLVLALLLLGGVVGAVAVVADDCDDCCGELGGRDCPPACASCLCCHPSLQALALTTPGSEDLRDLGTVRPVRGSRMELPEPRDISHVPKTLLS